MEAKKDFELNLEPKQVCDNTGCERDNDGQLCSGNGECHCGFCKCNPGYTGDACACKQDVERCISPETPGKCLFRLTHTY